MLLEILVAAALVAPGGIRWGASPQEVHQQLTRTHKFVGQTDGTAEQFLNEHRYEGPMLGLNSDHVAPMFFAGRLFALAASYSPAPSQPASMVWDQLVETLSSQHGKPKSRTKPLKLLSIQAVLKLLPDSANKSQLMEMYNAAAVDRRVGEYMIMDLQIQTRSWVPEAHWSFDGGTIRAVMRAGAPDQNGLMALKPAVIYTRYKELQ